MRSAGVIRIGVAIAALAAASCVPSSRDAAPSDLAQPELQLPYSFAPPRTSVDEIRRLLFEGGLSGLRVAEVAEHAEPAIQLHRDSAAGSIDGGDTHVGGYPLLAAETPWPERDGRPLSLVIQVDLDALDGRLEMLPCTGLLQVFTDLSDWVMVWEVQPLVVWYPDRTGFVERRGTADWGTDRVDLDFREIVSVPQYGDHEFSKWSADEQALLRELLAEPRSLDQLGGWPFELQGDPRVTVALDAAGLDLHDVRPDRPLPADFTSADLATYRVEFAENLETLTDIADWRVLVQLESAPGDSMWADGGFLFVLVRHDDAAARDYSSVGVDLQSH